MKSDKILNKQDWLEAKEKSEDLRRQALMTLNIMESNLELINKRLKMYPKDKWAGNGTSGKRLY